MDRSWRHHLELLDSRDVSRPMLDVGKGSENLYLRVQFERAVNIFPGNLMIGIGGVGRNRSNFSGSLVYASALQNLRSYFLSRLSIASRLPHHLGNSRRCLHSAFLFRMRSNAIHLVLVPPLDDPGRCTSCEGSAKMPACVRLGRVRPTSSWGSRSPITVAC
jgi:hypothetical protein